MTLQIGDQVLQGADAPPGQFAPAAGFCVATHFDDVAEVISGGSVSTGALSGFEALVRWRHPRRGILAPADFVPVAERTGLIDRLGAMVLEQACRTAAGWPRSGGKGYFISVNVSVAQLTAVGVPDQILAVVNAAGLHADITAPIRAHTEELVIDAGLSACGSLISNWPVNCLKPLSQKATPRRLTSIIEDQPVTSRSDTAARRLRTRRPRNRDANSSRGRGVR